MLKAACVLLFIGLAASESSVSSVVSRLLSQAKSSSASRPVILILNSRALHDSSSVEAPSPQSSEEGGLSMLNMLLGQIQKSRPKPALDRYRSQSDRLPTSSNRNKKKFPVYKSLLSLRNSLRCGARDECRDECTELPKKQEKKCAKKCEIKFECEEDKCQSNECGDDNVSTRAPPVSEEKQPPCPRC